MSQENVELAKEGIAAINRAYRTGDIMPWRRQVEEAFDPEVVLEAGTEAFTEGEWRGREGAVGFVANQMEVLEGMWLRVNEYIDVDEDWLNLLVLNWCPLGSSRAARQTKNPAVAGLS